MEEVEDAVGPGPIRVGEGQFDNPARPLGVGHVLKITEVGFRGLREGSDHLVSARLDRLKVAAELMDQAGGNG